MEVTMNDDKKKPILITGGSGFIGSYLAMALLEEGERVVLFDRNPDLRRMTGFKKRYEDVKDRLTFVQGDLSLLPHVLTLFDTHEPKSVFHLGALLSAGADANPTMGFQVDLVGTWHVLEAARLYCQRQKAPPVKVIFPSTIASFGRFIAPGAKVNNEAIQMPTTMYGVSKVSAERLGEYYNSRQPAPWVDFRAVRFPSVVGASRGPGGTTVYSTLLLEKPLQGKAYEAYVTPDTRLDILYVKDAVRALIELHGADAAKLTRRVYNIAGIRIDDQAPSAAEIKAAVVAERPNTEPLITFNPSQRLIDIIRTFGILDGTVAQQEWNWKMQFDTLSKVVKDFATEVERYPERILALELHG
jgi:threonine 3-dehydrogenase